MPDDNVFTDKTFWPKFSSDLSNARGRVVIQSPFISSGRIEDLSKTFASLINNGVTICAFVQEPRYWSADQTKVRPDIAQNNAEIKARIKRLEEMKVHVNLKQDIHQKLAIIDESALWEGSLNILSHFKSIERMRRFTDLAEIRLAIDQLDECHVCKVNYLEFVTDSSVDGLTHQLGRYRSFERIPQRELARRCGLSQGRVSQIEAGKNNICLSTFLTMANELDAEPILVPKYLVPSVTRLLRQASSPITDGTSP